MEQEPSEIAPADRHVHRHLLFGWWSLLCFATLGVVLESLHAFKVGTYLEGPYGTRRLMWTLGHAHGTLLALVHIAFAVTVRFAAGGAERFGRFASPLLIAASVLLPGGFFLGGVYLHGGDPGYGVLLVPAGALALLAAVLLVAVGVTRRPPGE